jgi:membrane protease YdiL (CAAX protease family)
MSDPASDHWPQSPSHNPIERTLNAASAIGPNRSEYFRLTKTLTYSYLFVLPLLVIYELGIWLVNTGELSQVRIGADILIKRTLNFIGIEGTFWMSALLIAIGIAIILYERRMDIPIRPRYFAFMFGESLLFGLVIGLSVASFVAQLFSIVWPPLLQQGTQSLTMAQGIVLSLGAGVYEELVFRLILVSGLVLLLRLIPIGDRPRYIIAALIGAAIFSAVHYIGELGDTFTLQSFTFRFLMGLSLNALFLWRGFGVAAMTHALYDILVTVAQGM